MYTEVKSYQLVIAMLKKYGIKHCVLSAGSRNVPFVHSVEKDPYFKCYSVVDERSAGYMALGLAQELNEPVLISCTASTASCNYYPPVAEAFYQGVPLVILTSDRDPEMMGQREDQMINQVNMFDRHVKKSVNLPIINNKDNEWYCQRLLNEALLELNHKGSTGPVHINVPTNSYNRTFNVKELPKVNKIERIYNNSTKDIWEKYANKLKESNKIMIICGQKNYVTPNLKKQVELFFNKHNSVIIQDHMSNIGIDEGINTIMSMDDNYINSTNMNNLMPEIVISFGGQVFSGLKGQLKKNYGKFEHWLISEDGEICDLFKGLKNIFECTPEEFFERINSLNVDLQNNMNYYNKFVEYQKSIEIQDVKYSGVYAIKNLVQNIPENSILHLSINDSIRISNFFDIEKNIKVYANIGTYGIDGCLSTFVGQSVASPEKKSFLIIGDLAFFYDMNALKINSIGKNVHVLMINNHGGSEFYYNKSWVDNSSDLHTTARHNVKAEGWVKENGFKYISANTMQEYDEKINDFINSDGPIFFEVFTEMKDDAAEIHTIYNNNRPHDMKTDIIRTGKEIVKKSFGQERAKKIINAFKK